ncbi:sel1 repeat family protein [Acinetobacter baumannii]|nr:sel1 repeat family protein [Acinetobacter baumannii]
MKFFLLIFIFSPLTLVGCDSSNIQVKSSNSKLSKYQKDAENGDPVAQYNMGVVYQQGLSGEKVDLDKAVYWFEKAAKRGEEDAKYNLGVIYISDNSKYRNVKKAMEIFLEGMGKNDAESINQLGIIYKDCIDTSVDNTKALSLLKQAANLGSNSAQFNLGIMYFKGQGVKQDFIEARKWFERAYKTGGNINAAYTLAGMYYEGRGGSKDIEKALNLYQFAADHGDQEAAKNIEIIKKNMGVNKNLLN